MSSQSERSEELDIDIISDNEGEKEDKWKTSFYFLNDESEKLFKCRFCDLKYSHKTSTTILKRHYNKQYLISSKQMRMTSYFKKNAPKENKTFGQCLSEFIINGNHAFTIVEEPGFVQLIRSLSSVEIPKRMTIRRDIMQLYNDLKTKTIELFRNMNCNIAITTDIWSSLSNDPYIAITAHFFKND
jgi:hypothetical protein